MDKLISILKEDFPFFVVLALVLILWGTLVIGPPPLLRQANMAAYDTEYTPISPCEIKVQTIHISAFEKEKQYVSRCQWPMPWCIPGTVEKTVCYVSYADYRVPIACWAWDELEADTAACLRRVVCENDIERRTAQGVIPGRCGNE